MTTQRKPKSKIPTVPTVPLIAKANYVINLPENYAQIGDTILLKGRVIDVDGRFVTFIFIQDDQ